MTSSESRRGRWGLEKRQAKKVDKQQNKGRASRSDGEQRSTEGWRAEEHRRPASRGGKQI
jgi:hypothetical protein